MSSFRSPQSGASSLRSHRVAIFHVRRLDGPSYWFRVNDFPAWPKPVTTDAEGRFELHGIGHRLEAQLSIIDPRFATQMIEVATDDSPDAKSLTAALQPARIFTGRVTYADTGKPVPEARIQIAAGGAGQRGFRTIPFQANADGRFRANPLPGDVFAIAAIPPVGEPYLAASRRIAWPKGAAEQSVDLVLPRGVPIRGLVTEEGSRLRSRRVGYVRPAFRTGSPMPAAGAVKQSPQPTDRSSSPWAPPPPVIWPFRVRARILCSGKSAIVSSSRVCKAAGQSIPTASSLAPEIRRQRPRGPGHASPRPDGLGPNRRSRRSAGSGYLDHGPGRTRAGFRGLASLVGFLSRHGTERPI